MFAGGSRRLLAPLGIRAPDPTIGRTSMPKNVYVGRRSVNDRTLVATAERRDQLMTGCYRTGAVEPAGGGGASSAGQRTALRRGSARAWLACSSGSGSGHRWVSTRRTGSDPTAPGHSLPVGGSRRRAPPPCGGVAAGSRAGSWQRWSFSHAPVGVVWDSGWQVGRPYFAPTNSQAFRRAVSAPSSTIARRRCPALDLDQVGAKKTAGGFRRPRDSLDGHPPVVGTIR